MKKYIISIAVFSSIIYGMEKSSSSSDFNQESSYDAMPLQPHASMVPHYYFDESEDSENLSENQDNKPHSLTHISDLAASKNQDPVEEQEQAGWGNRPAVTPLSDIIAKKKLGETEQMFQEFTSAQNAKKHKKKIYSHILSKLQEQNPHLSKDIIKLFDEKTAQKDRTKIIESINSPELIVIAQRLFVEFDNLLICDNEIQEAQLEHLMHFINDLKKNDQELKRTIVQSVRIHNAVSVALTGAEILAMYLLISNFCS